MQNTTNYSLPTWEQDDQIKMDDFNALTAKLDAALKSNADALTAEASAREAADSAKADATAVAALTAALGAGGYNCRVALGSYVGTGTGSVSAPLSIACGFRPVLWLLQPEDAHAPLLHLRTGDLVNDQSDLRTLDGTAGYSLRFSWGERAVSWYAATAMGQEKNAQYSGDVSGKTYHYLVLGCAD